MNTPAIDRALLLFKRRNGVDEILELSTQKQSSSIQDVIDTDCTGVTAILKVDRVTLSKLAEIAHHRVNEMMKEDKLRIADDDSMDSTQTDADSRWITFAHSLINVYDKVKVKQVFSGWCTYVDELHSVKRSLRSRSEIHCHCFCTHSARIAIIRRHGKERLAIIQYDRCLLKRMLVGWIRSIFI